MLAEIVGGFCQVISPDEKMKVCGDRSSFLCCATSPKRAGVNALGGKVTYFLWMCKRELCTFSFIILHMFSSVVADREQQFSLIACTVQLLVVTCCWW